MTPSLITRTIGALVVLEPAKRLSTRAYAASFGHSEEKKKSQYDLPSSKKSWFVYCSYTEEVNGVCTKR